MLDARSHPRLAPGARVFFSDARGARSAKSAAPSRIGALRGGAPLEWGARDAGSRAGIMPNAGSCRIGGHRSGDNVSFDAA
jgi:hypothetical protein